MINLEFFLENGYLSQGMRPRTKTFYMKKDLVGLIGMAESNNHFNI